MNAADNAAIVSETDAGHSHSSSDEDDEHRECQSTRTGPYLAPPAAARDDGITCGSIFHIGELSNYEQMRYDNSDAEMDREEPLSSAVEELYCENMDDEDEAWVYKHMRSGQEEIFNVRRQQQNQQRNIERDTKSRVKSPEAEDVSERKGVANPGSISSERCEKTDSDSIGLRKGNSSGGTDANNIRLSLQSQKFDSQKSSYLQQALLLKPRASDAVLSCPRCFNIVCMDCQQHERFANQFRAMFVMNIGVDWQKRMMYDEAIGGLKVLSSGHIEGQHSSVLRMSSGGGEDGGGRSSLPNAVPHEESGFGCDKDEIYYSVHCNYCRWEVAALDMTDEIYYFYGCIASSSS